MNNRLLNLIYYFCIFFLVQSHLSAKIYTKLPTNKKHKHAKKYPKQKLPKQKTLFLVHNNKKNSHECIANQEEEKSCKREHFIRVLLDEHLPQESCTLTLKSKDGFVLESPAHSNITAIFQKEELVLMHKNGAFFMRCQDGKYRKIKRNNVEICSPNEEITLNGQVYQGSIHVCQNKTTGSILIINKLELEDYLYSVIRHEGIPSWPHEMQKVLAVACRTFALYHMKQSRLKNPNILYDIKNTARCQVYKGSHEAIHLRKAVKETRNMTLTFNGEIALAMYDICCGGIISKNLRTRDTANPYLYREEPCNYCNQTTDYSWQEIFSKTKVIDSLRNNSKCNAKLAYLGSKLTDMKVIDQDKAGVVHKVSCTGKRSSITITGSEVKNALGLKSLAYSIKKDDKHFIFTGHGNSHFKGLCLWGAKALVDRGWNFIEVLQYYYPNTKIKYLK